MINDRLLRQKIRKWLIISIAVLAPIFLGLVIYGMVFVKYAKIEHATKLGQYYEFSSENLPSGTKGNLIMRKDISSPNGLHDNNAPLSPISEDTRPKIAILLTNLGLNKNSTELALSLPKEISLGFLPYTTTLKPMMAKALELHHEIFIYLPFETQRYPMDSPGHMPLLLNLSDAENLNRLDNLLNPFDGYIGVYASYKEAFTANINKSYPIINELKKRNLRLFLGHANKGVAFSGENEISLASADIVLDREPNIAAIKDNLDKLIHLAETNKSAVAYAEGYPVTIYTLKAWLPILEKRGIRLVPASSMMQNIGNNAQAQRAPK